MASESGEDDAAFVRLVAVVEQIAGHAVQPAASKSRRHQGDTLSFRFRAPRLSSPRRDVALLAEHFVGRAEELLAIDHTLARLDRGESAALEVRGEPGIGKTRLLTELAARADARGQIVLTGSASELERDLPFWVFVDAVDEYVRGLQPYRLDALDDDVRTELATVFPSLSRFAAGRAVFPHERYRTHRAVCGLLERLTATRPLALVLDDVHWADSASVDLLGALLRKPPDAAVLIALAVRPRQMAERLSGALERAYRAGALDRLELGAFTRGEAREFLGEAVDDAASIDLYDESGGNPFYLEQLARTFGRAPEGTATAPEPSPEGLEVPPAVASALAEELALLSDSARLVLEGAAVAGDPFEPELAAAATSIPEGSALEALDELLALDLIRQTDVPRRFRFRHPLVRRAVYESAPSGWRLDAHERCAAALTALGASAAERAHHVERSARRGDSAAIAILREAGEAAVQRAPASAAIWFGDALRLLPEAAPAEARIELLLARARVLAATGQFAEGRSALLESIGLVPHEAAALRVRLTTACAGIEHLLGRHDEAHGRLANAMDGLADPASPEAAALAIELAMDGFFLMEYERMRQWAEQALATARPLGDRPLTAAAAGLLAFACAADGASADAETCRTEAAALVDDLADDELALRLDAAANLAGAELYLDRYENAEAHAERALAVGLATSQSEFIPLPYSILGQVKLLRGHLAEAGEMLDNAVEGARLSRNVQALAGNLVNRSLTAVAAGDVDLALSTARENVDLTQGLDQSLVCAAGVALATALFETGDPARAVDTLVQSSGGDELVLIPGVWRTRSLELLTRCCLALGRREEGERAAARAETAAATLKLRVARSMADRAAAAVALDAGDPGLAADRALASAVAADEVGMPVEAAVSRTLAGRAFAQAGAPEPAIAELRHAAEVLHACGALRYRAAAERELRRLGQHVHRRTRAGDAEGSGIASLTARELQIARLVVDRRTNPQIAEALFLSPKTVETHMRNIFRKLGVSSRVAVARTVERADRAI
jgi:ATP/maltotriose-dependent transcriptional regulator MalT